MKTLAELEAIQKKTLKKANLDAGREGARIVVGMASCGVAAGARPVMQALLDEVARQGLAGVTVAQTGCIGMCRFEPMVEVTLPGQSKVTYAHVKPDMIPRIVVEHVMGGNPVDEYTIGEAEARSEK